MTTVNPVALMVVWAVVGAFTGSVITAPSVVSALT